MFARILAIVSHTDRLAVLTNINLLGEIIMSNAAKVLFIYISLLPRARAGMHRETMKRVVFNTAQKIIAGEYHA